MSENPKITIDIIVNLKMKILDAIKLKLIGTALPSLNQFINRVGKEIVAETKYTLEKQK